MHRPAVDGAARKDPWQMIPIDKIIFAYNSCFYFIFLFDLFLFLIFVLFPNCLLAAETSCRHLSTRLKLSSVEHMDASRSDMISLPFQGILDQGSCRSRHKTDVPWRVTKEPPSPPKLKLLLGDSSPKASVL